MCGQMLALEISASGRAPWREQKLTDCACLQTSPAEFCSRFDLIPRDCPASSNYNFPSSTPASFLLSRVPNVEGERSLP